MVPLATYDANWETRWEAAHDRWEAARAAGDWDAVARWGDEQNAAYRAQFPTVEAYRDHWIDLDLRFAYEGGWLPDIPDGLDKEEVDRRLAAWRAAMERAANEVLRPRREDPAGLAAFCTPARPGVQRVAAWISLDGHYGEMRFQVAIEYTDTQADVCFITAEAGRSVTNNIERLASRFYETWVRKPSRVRRLAGLRRAGEYRPADLRFYDYLPWRLYERDDFSAVTLRWSAKRGFHDPGWTSFKSVPPYLADLADYRCDPEPAAMLLPSRQGAAGRLDAARSG